MTCRVIRKMLKFIAKGMEIWEVSAMLVALVLMCSHKRRKGFGLGMLMRCAFTKYSHQVCNVLCLEG